MILISNSSNKIEFNDWIFPGGEVGVKLNLVTDDRFHHYTVSVIHQKLTSDDIFILLNIFDAIKRIDPYAIIDLYTAYLPYARQDRVCNSGESFALEVFISLLAGKISKLQTFDVHNYEVVSNLCFKYKISYYDYNVGYMMSRLYDERYLSNNTTIVLPDKGAAKKLDIISKVHRGKIIIADKIRDTVTGKVSHTIHENPSGEVLVLDDICDGGATFLSLAGLLTNANRVTLAVSHGIFSKGLVELLDHYDQIVCYNNLSGIQPGVGHHANFSVLN